MSPSSSSVKAGKPVVELVVVVVVVVVVVAVVVVVVVVVVPVALVLPENSQSSLDRRAGHP
jgi:hypothetical protein